MHTRFDNFLTRHDMVNIENQGMKGLENQGMKGLNIENQGMKYC